MAISSLARAAYSTRMILAVASTLIAGAAAALDLPTLDRISVMMSRDQVRYIAGPPDDAARLAPDLTLETWRMTGAPGMLAAGGIFDARGALIALAYVFSGDAGDLAFDHLRQFGFKVVDGADGVRRMYGADDDTGRPLVVILDERPDLTTVFAYEQNEYEKRLAAGPLPTGPGTPVAVAPAANPQSTGKMDPAVAAALASGVGMMIGGMKPMQASRTLSSSSSITRNSDGSVTTRSSSTSVSVSADPAGVANALMILMQKQ